MSFVWLLALALVACIWYLIYHALAFKFCYSLKGKIILVTGCDSGFGNALAQKLDTLGAVVFATCLQPQTAKQLNEATSRNLRIIMMDVTKPSEIRSAYKVVKKYCIDHQSALFGIVNNAGIATNGPFECCPRAVFNKVVEVNCIGLIDVTRTFLPLIRMKKYNPYIAGKYCKRLGGFYQRGKAGRIVNIASVAGRCPAPYMAAYDVSKFGVVGFTESIRYELDQFFNIWTCTVEPFFVMTDIVRKSMQLQHIKQQWSSVRKADQVDADEDEAKEADHDDDIGDEVEGVMDVYDVEKYLEWKQENNAFVDLISIKSKDHVVDSIVAALSSVYPLKVYYPSWAATIMVRLSKYVLPAWLIEKEFQMRVFQTKPLRDSFLR